MEKIEILYSICLNKKNISMLIEVICEDVKLSKRSVPKCVEMIQDIMKKNISKLSRPPKNREEINLLAKHLNKICISTIIEIISKKYPDLHISKKRQMSKEQMRRDLDVYGNRENYIQDRPFLKSRKEHDDDETFYNMKPNDIGYDASDSTGGYASAYGNHLISNIPLKYNNNNPSDHKNESNMQQRLQQMVDERNYEKAGIKKPDTPDFTWDGSGDEVRRRKMQKRIEYGQDSYMDNNNNNNGNMDNNGNICGMSSGMSSGMNNMDDNLYASLLGAGAPGQNFGQSMDNQNMNQFGPIGQGNPLMPMSSTNLMADQLGYNGMNTMHGGYSNGGDFQSVKSMKLQDDYEKKLAERQLIDMETNQPHQHNQSYDNNNNNNNNNIMQMPNTMQNMIPTNGGNYNGMNNMSNTNNMCGYGNMYGITGMTGMTAMPNMNNMQMTNMNNMQMTNQL